MAYQFDTKEGKKLWDVSLRGDEGEKFRLAICLQRLDGKDVLNRGWRGVGPEFAKRAEGIKYYGLSTTSPADKDASHHLQQIWDEYERLFTEPIQTK